MTHLSDSVEGQPAIEPKQVNFPNRAGAPGLPEVGEHGQPELPRLLGGNVPRRGKEQGEVADGGRHRSELT